MSHDCDCSDCMETDSRWAPWRAARAAKKDCDAGKHVSTMMRCTVGDPSSIEYWCTHCHALCTKRGSPLKRKAVKKKMMTPSGTMLLPALRCAKHPRYQGKRRPRASCEECHYIWEKNQT